MSEPAYAEPPFPERSFTPSKSRPIYPDSRAEKLGLSSKDGREKPANRRRVVCACVTVVAIVVVVVVQLLLSVGLSHGAYRLDALRDETKELARTSQSVSSDLQRLSSPQNLAANAEGLGMVKNASPVYLRLSDGAVLGMPSSAASNAGPLVGHAGVLVPNSLLGDVALAQQSPQSSPVPPVTVASVAPPTEPAAPGSPPAAPAPSDSGATGNKFPSPNGGLAAPSTH